RVAVLGIALVYEAAFAKLLLERVGVLQVLLQGELAVGDAVFFGILIHPGLEPTRHLINHQVVLALGVVLEAFFGGLVPAGLVKSTLVTTGLEATARLGQSGTSERQDDDSGQNEFPGV